MKFVDELQNYLKARYPLILIKSTEEDRLTMDLKLVAKILGHDLITWSIASGLKSDNKQVDGRADTLLTAIDTCESIAKTEKPTIFVFYDIVPFISSGAGPVPQRRLKEFALNIRTNGYRCNCILVSSKSEIDGSINSEITVLDYPLPNRQEVSEQISKFINQYKGMKEVSVDTSTETLSALTSASLGLTYAEIENCLARALVEDHKLDINDIKSIVNEKKQIIRKSGILEYVENKLSLEDVGGLTVLKRWLELRGKTFSEDAKAFGLNPPKGVLLVGIPGCGKSLTAKCIASAWSMPLLKLDMGKIFGKSGRNLANFDLDKLAQISGEDNYGANIRLAGAEIEAWVKDALMEAYARKTNGEDGADLSMQDFETVIKRMIPMAKMRQEDFKDLRDWANENAVSASVSSATTSNSNDSLGGRRIDLI